jgi:hypothetical protein
MTTFNGILILSADFDLSASEIRRTRNHLYTLVGLSPPPMHMYMCGRNTCNSFFDNLKWKTFMLARRIITDFF